MLAQQAQLASAERGANGLLPAPRRRPRHQQVGHIEAGDQQYAARGCQQGVERRLHRPHDRFKQGAAVGGKADEGLIQMLIVNAARDEREVGNRLRFRHAGRRRPMTLNSCSSSIFIRSVFFAW